MSAFVLRQLEGRTVRALVVEPANLMRTKRWRTEAAAWTHLDHLTFEPLGQGLFGVENILGDKTSTEEEIVKRRRKVDGEWIEVKEKASIPRRESIDLAVETIRTSKADLFLVTYDALEWLADFIFPRLQCFPFDLVIFDEITKMKSHQIRRFKRWKKWVSRYQAAWGLTGKPAPQGLIDLWSQTFCIDNGKALGTSVVKFRHDRCMQTDYLGYKFAFRDSEKPWLRRQIGPYVVRLVREKKSTPEVRDIWVDLPPKARRVYDTLEREMIAEMDDGQEIEANSAAALSMKCHQIANGAIYTAPEISGEIEERPFKTLHNAKLDALAAIVDNMNGKPLLIGRGFKHDYRRIAKAFNVAGLGGANDFDLVQAFGHGNTPLLCAYPGSVGHGTDGLQYGGSTIAFFSMLWSLDYYEQFIARLDRRGQTGSVLVYRILARDTVDEAIRGAIISKARNQDELLEKLREYCEARRELLAA